ncbi:MAG: autotransporter assembly complex protein TamA [Novosphingobium sp.]
MTGTRRDWAIATNALLLAAFVCPNPALAQPKKRKAVAAQTSPVGSLPETPPTIPAPPPDAKLPAVEPIITDDEFKAAIPKLDPADDPELAKPLESIADFERRVAAEQAGAKPREGALPPAGDTALADKQAVETIGDAPINDAELTKPLPPLEQFKVEPVQFVDAPEDTKTVEVDYQVQLSGLDKADAETEADLTGRFNSLSALRSGKGRAANAAQVASREGEDAALLKKLLAAEGWFDAQVVTRLDRSNAENGQPLLAVIEVSPGKRFSYATITVDAAPTIPPDLIRSNLALKVGDPVRAEQVLVEEAKVALALPENGYPFAALGQRDVLLDQDTGGADYTLPVTVGPRGTYGDIVSQGNEAFGADHIKVLARFKPGELYDSRKVDDLRQALIATGLFKGVGVEPRRTGQPGPDGTEVVELVVKQDAGPPRVIAATAGYATGEGFRAEASWTHRNFLRPEGALIISGVAGTQEQGAGATFRRSNTGKRDRTFELAADLHHSEYDAFSAYTGRLAARVSYDSTPLWQKRFTYAYGVQLIGTNESVYDFSLAQRVRRTYGIAGLSGQAGFDTTDSLLDPTRGFRFVALVEPEGSLNRGFSPYARLRLDGSTYRRFGGSLTLAARARIATIQGASLDDLAPSRRIYAGGGGSVRGFGYQQLGPRDPNNDPIGGRSLIEGAVEARYRFGDYGVVAFADVGQSYTETLPTFRDLRVGVGLGARVYTNFGPVRIDVATPLARRTGESRINVYVSIGQAF